MSNFLDNKPLSAEATIYPAVPLPPLEVTRPVLPQQTGGEGRWESPRIGRSLPSPATAPARAHRAHTRHRSARSPGDRGATPPPRGWQQLPDLTLTRPPHSPLGSPFPYCTAAMTPHQLPAPPAPPLPASLAYALRHSATSPPPTTALAHSSPPGRPRR